MSIFKEIEWQALAFVGASLLQEYLVFKIRVPRIEYWSMEIINYENQSDNKSVA